MDTPLLTLTGIFLGYFVLQIIGNAVKLSFSRDMPRVQMISFGASMASHAYLILGSLITALVMGLDFRVGLPKLSPDVLLLLLGLIIYLFIFLLDVYLRLVMRRRRPGALLDVDEQLIITPQSSTTWELALFNFVLLRGFAYEVFLRGFALTVLMSVFDNNPIAPVIIVIVMEFLLRPIGERLVPTVIISLLLSVIFLSLWASGGLLVTIIIRIIGNYIVSLYMVYLTFKGSGESKA
jgi:hypothetical protein